MIPRRTLSRTGWAAVGLGLLLLAVLGAWLIAHAPAPWVIGHAWIELGI